jgi:hypothetical protein
MDGRRERGWEGEERGTRNAAEKETNNTSNQKNTKKKTYAFVVVSA